MSILSRRQQSATFIVGVVIVFLSILLSFAVPQLNRKIVNISSSPGLRVTKMQCIETPYKRSHLYYCEMVHLPNDTIGLNVSVNIPMVLHYFEITVKLYYKYTTYRPFMIDWSVELCQALRRRKLNPSTAVVMRIIAESIPEFNYPCPHGNRTYTTFWTFHSSFIPSSIPSGDYRLDIHFRDATRSPVIAVQTFGSVRKQGLIG